MTTEKDPWVDSACADCPGFLVAGAASDLACSFVLRARFCPRTTNLLHGPLDIWLGSAAHHSPTTCAKKGRTAQALQHIVTRARPPVTALGFIESNSKTLCPFTLHCNVHWNHSHALQIALREVAKLSENFAEGVRKVFLLHHLRVRKICRNFAESGEKNSHNKLLCWMCATVRTHIHTHDTGPENVFDVCGRADLCLGFSKQETLQWLAPGSTMPLKQHHAQNIRESTLQKKSAKHLILNPKKNRKVNCWFPERTVNAQKSEIFGGWGWGSELGGASFESKRRTSMDSTVPCCPLTWVLPCWISKALLWSRHERDRPLSAWHATCPADGALPSERQSEREIEREREIDKKFPPPPKKKNIYIYIFCWRIRILSTFTPCGGSVFCPPFLSLFWVCFSKDHLPPCVC